MPAPKSNALTDAKLRGKLPPGRYVDGRGLALWVSGQGAKSWQLRYRLGKEENTFTLGRFPEVGVAQARQLAEKARSQIAEGRHPKDVRQEELAKQRAANADTFEVMASKWLAQLKLSAGSQRVYGCALGQVLPALGKRPVSAIRAGDVREMLDGIKSATTRKNALMIVRGVLDDAAELEKIEINPVRAKAMKPSKDSAKKPKVKHRAALLRAEELGEFAIRLDAYPSARFGASVQTALRLLMLLPARPMEIAQMRWADVDLEAGEWNYHVSKTDEPHTLHLPSQAVEILRAWKAQKRPGVWVFPSPVRDDQAIGRAALLNGVVDVLEYPRGTLSAHGFRASFRTVARRELKVQPTVLELMLSHQSRKAGTSGLGWAYDRDEWLEERRAAAQAWADYLSAAKADAQGRGYVWSPSRKPGRPRKQVD